MRSTVSRLAVVVGFFALSPNTAWAQPLGSFTWQLQPFCNRVTMTVTQNGGIYTLDGYDDQCGAAQRAPLVGLATFNPDGTIGMGLNIVTVPGGQPVSVDARISLAGLGGPWSDSAGNGGTFAFNGQAAGSPRPAVVVGALPPNVVNTTTIVDGSVGAADIDSTQIQRRLTGPCARGLYMTTAAQSGLPTCGAGGTLVALGTSAGAANTASRNTAIGFEALTLNVAGLDNTAVGSQSLRSLNPAATTGGNTAVGSGTMFAATTAVWNTAVGDASLSSLQTGTGNVAIGRNTLRSITFTANNTAVGNDAAFNATGFGNTAIGAGAAFNVVGGNNNIHIGNLGLSGDASTIKIGTPGLQTSAFLAGVTGVVVTGSAVIVNANGQLGVATSSRRFKEDIQDMDDRSARLLQLRPVTFRYRRALEDGSKPLDFGLIAEEVAETFPELAIHGADGQVETVAYHKLPALLLNELQKQQRTIEVQAAAIAALTARLTALEATTSRDQR